MQNINRQPADSSVINHTRLEYIDALRGFAILLVISTHMHTFVWNDGTAFDSILEAIRMPLFFFISGYLAYTASMTKDKFRKRITNRINKQLKPTVIVWCVYIVFIFYFSTRTVPPFHEYFTSRLFDPMKSGYWFTLSLVEVFLFFVAVNRACCLKGLAKSHVAIIFTGCSVFCVSASILYPTVSSLLPDKAIRLMDMLCIEKTLSLSGYFFFGAICKVYTDLFQKIISNKSIIIFIVAIFLVINQLYIGGGIGYKINSFLGVLIPFSLFFAFRRQISSSSPFWQFWIHAGKNTLPTYLFHYFFIFIITGNFIAYSYLQIPTLDEIIPDGILKSCISIMIAIGILWLTLLVDNLIKGSDKVHKLVFG